MSEPETPAAPPPPDDPSPPSGGPPSPPPGDPPPSPPTGSDNRSLMVVLAYLWILALIPLLTEKDDADLQWHAKHGLVLTAAEVVFWLAIGLVNAMSGFVGCLLMPLYVAGWLAILGVHIVCMIKGVKGERLLIPGISQYADRF